MRPPVPRLEDYGISGHYGFLPPDLPLEKLSDPYYEQWEIIIANLQPLLLSKRLRSHVRGLPILLPSKHTLHSPAEWKRAYVVLAFITHAYIWGGAKPEERVPPSISIPFLKVCKKLELPLVATYAGVCLWNFKPILPSQPLDLENIYTLHTFTGSLDESWFYLVSVAIEARGAPLIPLMLDAVSAARYGNIDFVTEALVVMAQGIDEIGSLLLRMYENCDPHVFYHRVRPFLAGSKNMAEAGLPNGVIFEDGSGTEPYRQYGGGSNAQSSLIQFFDLILGIEHRPTGEKKSDDCDQEDHKQAQAPPARHNFIHEMRSYMPGPHRRFLEHVASVANIREFVEQHRHARALTIAYDACLAMLRTLRDHHIKLVSRYIIIKSREARRDSISVSSHTAGAGGGPASPMNLASASSRLASDPHRRDSISSVLSDSHRRRGDSISSNTSSPAAASTTKKPLRGTGGTALIPFLKQARDETGEPTIDHWARRLLSRDSGGGAAAAVVAVAPEDHQATATMHSPTSTGARSPRSIINSPKLAKSPTTTTTTTTTTKSIKSPKMDSPKAISTSPWGRSRPSEVPREDVPIVGLAGTWKMDDSEGGLCHW